MKVLVAYFSVGSSTKQIAQKLALAAQADLFEIVPAEPYTESDLNVNNENSRTSQEMYDLNARPAVASKLDQFNYDVIFLGFPIWWYREPRIVDTFLETYDFSGKAVIPFSTSDGSVIGDSFKYIQEIIPDAFVDQGMKFEKNVTIDQLTDFIREYI
ncbi:MAG: flavodoxin [bacterium]